MYARENNHDIYFYQNMSKAEVLSRMKKANLSQNNLHLVIMMINNTPEIRPPQKNYRIKR